MSKEEKPILNLEKGCPFCDNTDLCYGYDPVLNRVDIVCKACNFTFLYKIEKPTNASLLAENIWNSRADEKKPTAKIQYQQRRLSYQNLRILSHM